MLPQLLWPVFRNLWWTLFHLLCCEKNDFLWKVCRFYVDIVFYSDERGMVKEKIDMDLIRNSGDCANKSEFRKQIYSSSLRLMTPEEIQILANKVRPIDNSLLNSDFIRLPLCLWILRETILPRWARVWRYIPIATELGEPFSYHLNSCIKTRTIPALVPE